MKDNIVKKEIKTVLKEKLKSVSTDKKRVLTSKKLSQLQQLAEEEKNDPYFKRLREKLLTHSYMEDIAKRAKNYEEDGKFLYFAHQLLVLLDKHNEMLHRHAMEREKLEIDKLKIKYAKEHLALETMKIKALYSTEDESNKKDIIKSLDEKIFEYFGVPNE